MLIAYGFNHVKSFKADDSAVPDRYKLPDLGVVKNIYDEFDLDEGTQTLLQGKLDNEQVEHAVTQLDMLLTKDAVTDDSVICLFETYTG